MRGREGKWGKDGWMEVEHAAGCWKDRGGKGRMEDWMNGRVEEGNIGRML